MNEETLICYYYGDGLSDTERRTVESALATDAELATQYASLCRELDGLARLWRREHELVVQARNLPQNVDGHFRKGHDVDSLALHARRWDSPYRIVEV